MGEHASQPTLQSRKKSQALAECPRLARAQHKVKGRLFFAGQFLPNELRHARSATLHNFTRLPTSGAKTPGSCKGVRVGTISLTFGLLEPKSDGRIPSRKQHVETGVVGWKGADDGQGFAGILCVNGAKEDLDMVPSSSHRITATHHEIRVQARVQVYFRVGESRAGTACPLDRSVMGMAHGSCTTHYIGTISAN